MQGVTPVRLSLLARLCWALDGRRWMLSVCNVVAAALFVVGCVGFYVPVWYVGSVTLFLVGSVLFLLSALGHALVEHGPST
jgi:YrhK-like protein